MDIRHGDCLEILKNLEENSVDSLITDPPAGISFMNKSWDSDKGGRDAWIAWMTEVMRECNRVLKPGAHALVWSIPRTSHWTATAIEDAGFEIRDVVTHLFGSGFPKSLDISKAIDKAAGETRTTEYKPNFKNNDYGKGMGGGEWNAPSEPPKTPDAIKWSGFGTALKPAAEFWVLARKPLSEKTVAKNVLKHGTGGLNIDGSRIAPTSDYGRSAKNSNGTISAHEGFDGKAFKINERSGDYASPLGRFPANLVLSGAAIEELDEQSGHLHGSGNKSDKGIGKDKAYDASSFEISYEGRANRDYGAKGGGASRFFYCAKVSPSERGEGNNHPTVKSRKLMQYLIKLITPPGGTVLDPFMGSGSTGLACKQLGFKFIGIEKEQEYVDTAIKRMTPGDRKDTGDNAELQSQQDLF